MVMGEDASSQPVTVTFWILDAEQSAYRFMIAVWDAYPGLGSQQSLSAGLQPFSRVLNTCYQ